MYPDTWVRYNLKNVNFESADNLQPGYRFSPLIYELADNAVKPAIAVYSVTARKYVMQVLLDDTDLQTLISFIKRLAPGVFFLAFLLSIGLSYIVFVSILNPVYKINDLVEHIITKQTISSQLPSDKKGAFSALEQNINEMLDTIERLVTRLKTANLE